MLSIAAVSAALTLLSGADDGRGSPPLRTPVVPLFSGFPVREVYTGPLATPKPKSASDREHLQALLGGATLAPNFAGHFRIVQFRTGSGPIGALLVDAKSGSVFHLPREIVRDGLFIDGADCLPSLRGLPWARLGDEEDPSTQLSFKTDSELLIVRQCRVDGRAVDRSYYRWHGREWHLVKRFASPPPPAYVLPPPA